VTAGFLTGAALAIRTAGWFLPQFFSARLVSSSPSKKPVLLLACWTGRLPFAGVAAYLLFSGRRFEPMTLLLLFFGAWILFSIGEGFAGVPWTYIISKAIPARRRGRLFGLMQIIGGSLAAGAGAIVVYLVGHRSPGFPRSFGVLFSLLFLFLMVSQTCLILLREPAAPSDQEVTPPMWDYLRQIPSLLSHGPFRQVALVQLLAAFGSLAAPVYTLYGTQTLKTPAALVGAYLSATMVGTVAGSILYGYVNDHLGPHRVIRINMAASVLAPAAAFAVAAAHRGGFLPGALQSAYCVSFFLSGVVFSGSWAGYTAYVLEMVPPDKRAEYVGLINTLNGPAVVMPLIGAQLAAMLSSEAAFAIASLGCCGAYVLSRKLPGQHLVQHAAPV